MRDSAVSSSWRSYGYDSRGNVNSDGRHTFTYDDANQPTAIAGADSGSYVYDGNLRRAKQVVGGKIIYSIYDRAGELLTRSSPTTGDITDYISLQGQTFVRVVNGTRYYMLNDHLGTAYMVADQDGWVRARRNTTTRHLERALESIPASRMSRDSRDTSMMSPD